MKSICQRNVGGGCECCKVWPLAGTTSRPLCCPPYLAGEVRFREGNLQQYGATEDVLEQVCGLLRHLLIEANLLHSVTSAFRLPTVETTPWKAKETR